MAFKTACAIALLAIGISLAAPALAEDGGSPAGSAATAPAAAPAHAEAEIDRARGTSIGLTVGGFIVGGLGGFFALGAGFGGHAGRLWGGALASAAVFAVGPSVGHYMLGSPLRASLTMLGRLVLGTAGTGFFGIGLASLGGRVGAGYAAGGVVCWLTSIIVAIADLATFGAYGEPATAEKDAAVEVAPTAWAGPNSAGLAAVGAF